MIRMNKAMIDWILKHYGKQEDFENMVTSRKWKMTVLGSEAGKPRTRRRILAVSDAMEFDCGKGVIATTGPILLNYVKSGLAKTFVVESMDPSPFKWHGSIGTANADMVFAGESPMILPDVQTWVGSLELRWK